MKTLVVQCANANVLWFRVGRHAPHPNIWHCQNDGFETPAPTAASELVDCIRTITQHSAQIGGKIVTVTQLDL